MVLEEAESPCVWVAKKMQNEPGWTMRSALYGKTYFNVGSGRSGGSISLCSIARNGSYLTII